MMSILLYDTQSFLKMAPMNPPITEITKVMLGDHDHLHDVPLLPTLMTDEALAFSLPMRPWDILCGS